ncbi:hypothetical protein VTH06DRAFT_3806, partial [Thermothelomyces fergusii]
EILNHYCDVNLPVQQRREWAQGSLGGWCMCRRCREEAAAAAAAAAAGGGGGGLKEQVNGSGACSVEAETAMHTPEVALDA